MIDRQDIASVTVRIYHVCPAGATGSALGPRGLVSYWWAEPGNLRVASSGSTDEIDGAAIEEAIIAALGGSQADRIREAQDLAAESLS